MVGEWNGERSETKGFCFRLAKRWTGKMGNAATHGTNVVPCGLEVAPGFSET